VHTCVSRDSACFEGGGRFVEGETNVGEGEEAEKTKRVKEGEEAREEGRERERERERGPMWRCSLVARSTNCQVIGPVPPLV